MGESMSRYGLTIDEDRKLKRILREKVMQRQDSLCLRCRSLEGLDAHHLYTQKMYPGMKFELTNVIGLCRRCHRWVHDNPAKAIRWLETAVTAVEWAFLHEASKYKSKVRFYFEDELEKLR